mmetsp:Transcript_17976/g.54612  ORF Transcript_17976/g.54612 Transcript_17976/m.54612 type:complete len:271 (+) Transcript_17976:254-1066(+)
MHAQFMRWRFGLFCPSTASASSTSFEHSCSPDPFSLTCSSSCSSCPSSPSSCSSSPSSSSSSSSSSSTSSAASPLAPFPPLALSSSSINAQVGNHATTPTEGANRTRDVPSELSSCVTVPRLPHSSANLASHWIARLASTASLSCPTGATRTRRLALALLRSELTRPCAWAMAMRWGSSSKISRSWSCVTGMASVPSVSLSPPCSSSHLLNHCVRSALPTARSLGGPSPNLAISSLKAGLCTPQPSPPSPSCVPFDCRTKPSTRSLRAAS